MHSELYFRGLRCGGSNCFVIVLQVETGAPNMSTPLFRPLKRLRGKETTLVAYGMAAQERLPPELVNDGDIAKRQVYLVTCSHPHQAAAANGTLLRKPNTYSHQHLLDALLDSCAKPVYDAGNAARGFGGVRLCRCLVAAEYHKAGAAGQANRHYHIAVQAFGSFRFGSVKRAMLDRHGIPTHWSATHVGYWSALSYLVKKSVKKPIACLDPKPLAWHHGDVVEDLKALAQRPTTAASIEARREKAVERSELDGKGEPKPSEIDIWPLVVKHDIHNDHDDQNGVDKLIQIAKDSCTPTMFRYLFKMRHKLAGIIDDIWHWERIDDRVLLGQRSREGALQDAAGCPCVCGGKWTECVQESLVLNGIPAAELAHDIFTSFKKGRSETTPVVCLAGLQGGEGKSLIFYPIPAVLGEDFVCHHTAAGKFALLDLQGKKAALLDEWDFNTPSVPLSQQLLWFEGKPIPITRPQNDFAGHTLYKGTAPIFITTPLKRMERFITDAAWAARSGESSEATMMLRRLKLYKFSRKIRKPADQIPQCASCFAAFVLEGEAAFHQG